MGGAEEGERIRVEKSQVTAEEIREETWTAIGEGNKEKKVGQPRRHKACISL